MRILGTCLLALAWVLPAHASTFNIAPIRAELSAAHRTEALTIVNAEAAPVVVQVRVLAWSQKDGAEQLDDTRELLATPPVLQIPANGQQIVRVALRREPDLHQELSYRVVFEEVPQAAPKEFNGLRVALRLSIPVFVAPAQGKAASELRWESQWLPGGALQVAVTNHGTAHCQVTDFEARLPGLGTPVRGGASRYVLQGSRVVWTLNPPAEAQREPLTLRGHSDQGDFSAEVAPRGP